jgi:hypothetical protein
VGYGAVVLAAASLALVDASNGHRRPYFYCVEAKMRNVNRFRLLYILQTPRVLQLGLLQGLVTS